MSVPKTVEENPGWVSQIQGLDIEFYDAAGELDNIEGIDLPYADEVDYVSMDDIEYVNENTVGTSGIFHCVGVVVPGDSGYLAHVSPGDIGKTAEELLGETEEDVESVTYALGNSPDLGLLEDVRNNFHGDERVIYTGNNGSIAVDADGDFYRIKDKGNKSPLSF